MNARKWHANRVVALTILLVLALTVGLTHAQEPEELNGAIANFDGDDYADLAIGVYYEDVGSIENAGAVNVLYGSDANTGGLDATGNQYWRQGGSGVVDAAETEDIFGAALAVGDFDGDGYVDLAIGVPDEDVGNIEDAGAVHILYGADGGLTATDDRLWHQNSADIEGVAEYQDGFGHSLAVGDFDGDGYDDLAIGVLNEQVGSVANAGCVNIIYGSVDGLTAAGDQLWHKDSTDIEGTAQDQDWFGYSLAAGDFDGDGYADLAIGAPHEDIGNIVRAGSVNVIYGSAGGLAAAGDWWFHQNTTDILDTCGVSDRFGWALTAGDFDGDGYADLAIGVPYEDYDGENGAGAVNVVFGSTSGLTTRDQFWHQSIGGLQDAAEAGDLFGWALAAGDFDADGYVDLAVGIPDEDDGSTLDTGAVHVIYGADGGLTIAGDWFFHQNTPDILDTAEGHDNFGHALAAGDFDGDDYMDLAIGVPYENVGSIYDAGAVNVVYGSVSGLDATGDQFWHQDSPDLQGTAEAGDRFGYALAAFPMKIHKLYLPLVLRE